MGLFLSTGEHVLNRRIIVEVCSTHLTPAPGAPSERRGEALPEGLDERIARLLAKDPDARPASAAEVQAAVAKIEGFGPWTQESARRWGRELGPGVRGQRQHGAESLGTRALAIDLGRRT